MILGILDSISTPAIVRNSRVDWWAAHNVRYHQTGAKRLRHPVVGELEIAYEVMNRGCLAADVYQRRLAELIPRRMSLRRDRARAYTRT